MRVKRKCELCSNIATIFCESDQANLCYECDSKVHGANFLVSKHSRTLLCHICQSPTLWSGSGPKFGPTLSVCPGCLIERQRRDVGNNGNGGREVADEDYDDDDNDDDDDDDNDDDGDNGYEDDESDDGNDDVDEDEDDEENQVVPWSYSVSHPG
ncbi:phosphopantothenoylcysteine decarboxylase subunit VHS3-like [Spinacia oleracea]|uniref:Phosphopantothenoylcysteine decarboxylase subunit VHS3-like n=1 Tax=Spinacia oleracea TaxID=3562 RepID=A0A9R0I207_SPIOL|nr:phosphopantothenoylcysteine decarboxylase subunit VHS3-like [Spinacia oleracea]